MDQVECRRCAHIWLPRVSSPAQCPKCKSYDWREPKPVEVE